MKRRFHSFLSVALTLSMLLSLCVPVWAANGPVDGSGTSDAQFMVNQTSGITAYRKADGQYALSFDNNTQEFSSSYFVASGGGSQVGNSKTYTNLSVDALVVGAGEYVVLSANLPTELRGDGVLTYNVGGAYPVITGADSSGAGKPLNTLLVASGRTAHVTGAFKTVDGKVQPAGDVTLGGSGYMVSGDADDSHQVTLNGSAKVSGTFDKLILNAGASVEITGDTVLLSGITIDPDSTLTVQQGVTLCVNGSSVKPAANTRIRQWGTLSAGSYTAVSGSWTLLGDVTISGTVCGCAGHDTNETVLTAALGGNTLTVKDGTVKASGGSVVGEGGKAALRVTGENVTASGAFRSITMEGGNTLTVRKDETISAQFTDTDNTVYTNSVTVLQDTEFTSFNGVLPTRTVGEPPYQFTNLSGKWSNTDTVTGSETYVGNNATLTVTNDNMVISGTFAKLNTGDHSVRLGGSTEIAEGSYTIVGETPYDLTINGGEATVTGALRTLTVNGGTVTDKADGTLTIDNTATAETYTGIRVNGGELLLANEPEIKINGGAGNPAVYVPGGRLTMRNGTVEAWGNSIHAIEASSGGTVILGDEAGIDASGAITVPSVVCHDSSSVALFVNNGSKAWVYDADIGFNGENSYGIRVNSGGETYLYANDAYGENNLDLNKPLIHVHGTHGAMAAVWVNAGGLVEVRGRGALLEQPERNDGAGYALYIHSAAKDGCVLSGGTYNGDVFYQTNDAHTIPGIIPVNHYLRFDGSEPNYAASDGGLGILPKGEYTDAARYGGFVGNFDEENAFDETYLDRFGASGSYYSIVDAEWELRDRMARGGSYQLPAGLLDGTGAVTDTLTLDAGAVADWGIARKQGDVNVSATATLYLAGRTLCYDGASLSSAASAEKTLLTDTDQDAMQTIAVTGGSLTVIDAVVGGAGTAQTGDKFAGAYIGTGTIRYTGSDAGETAAVHVCDGALRVTSGKLVNSGAANGSGVILHGGTADFGTVSQPNADESNDNAIILVNGAKQALKVEQGAATVYGGALKATGSAAVYGAVLTDGTLSVKGGVLSGNHAGQGSGVYATGGTATITGGALYGIYRNDGSGSNESGTSLCVDGATVNLQIDETHSAYLTEATEQTAQAHHICNVNVKSGTLNIGTHGASDDHLRNNGTLVLEGGTTCCFDGATMGDTVVYGADVTGAAKGYGTRFYVERGDFGALRVLNHNGDASPAYSYAHSGADSLRENVQLHGGYYSGIEVLVTADDGAASVQDVIGVWVNRDHDGVNGADWARYNHYAETVTSERAASGAWSAVEAIQSGAAQTGDAQRISAAPGEAVAVRNAANEFKAWAASATEQPYLLHANLWLGEGLQCAAAYCDAAHERVTVANGAHALNLNGFGIFGSTADALLSVGSDGALTLSQGSNDATAAYADRVRNLGSGATLDVTADGALTVEGGKLNSNSGTAITTTGATAVNGGSIMGAGYGIDQTGGTLTVTDGTISGKTYGLHRSGASDDNRNCISGGTFTGIQTEAAGETLSDLLAEGKSLRDKNSVELGGDALGKAAVASNSKSGDSATGGDSVKWTNDAFALVSPTDTVTAPFTVTERTVSEIALTSGNNNTTVTVTDAVKAVADDSSVCNETKTLYIAKDGGSATAIVTPDSGYCTGAVTRNGENAANLSHRNAAQNVALTAQDTALSAAAVPFHIEEAIETGITSVVSGSTYTLSGTNLAQPTVGKMDAEGKWVSADDVTVTAVDGGYTVAFPTLHSDYRLTAKIARASGGGGGGFSAPVVPVSVPVDEETVCPKDSTCPMAKFPDVKLTEWYHDGIHWALETGVMDGLSSGLFAPNCDITRAMLATMLWRLEGSPAYDAASAFKDVNSALWYGKAVGWATDAGIITGYDDPAGAGRLFGPNRSATREQLAVMLYRYAQYKKLDVSVGEDTNILSYEDALSVGSWAMPAMQWACGAGIIGGVDRHGTMYLLPNITATRAVVATMLMRFDNGMSQ